ncbi:MAG: hypothetical protein AAF250_10980 [Pseudomonadota bacterium]
MINTLFALAATGLGLGASPLADPGHQHDWVLITDNEEGQAWRDTIWNGTFEQDGKQLELVLLRLNITIPNELMEADMVMAVDCSAGQLGIKEAYLHRSNFGSGVEAPIEQLSMDFADSPPSQSDRDIIEAACGETAE